MATNTHYYIKDKVRLNILPDVSKIEYLHLLNHSEYIGIMTNKPKFF
jgi:hypothetical protein